MPLVYRPGSFEGTSCSRARFGLSETVSARLLLTHSVRFLCDRTADDDLAIAALSKRDHCTQLSPTGPVWAIGLPRGPPIPTVHRSAPAGAGTPPGPGHEELALMPEENVPVVGMCCWSTSPRRPAKCRASSTRPGTCTCRLSPASAMAATAWFAGPSCSKR